MDLWHFNRLQERLSLFDLQLTPFRSQGGGEERSQGYQRTSYPELVKSSASTMSRTIEMPTKALAVEAESIPESAPIAIPSSKTKKAPEPLDPDPYLKCGPETLRLLKENPLCALHSNLIQWDDEEVKKEPACIPAPPKVSTLKAVSFHSGLTMSR